jgi:hypothetical protein
VGWTDKTARVQWVCGTELRFVLIFSLFFIKQKENKMLHCLLSGRRSKGRPDDGSALASEKNGSFSPTFLLRPAR